MDENPVALTTEPDEPAQLVSFPSPPHDEEDTAIGKLYSKVHKRLASIVTTAAATVMTAEPAPTPKHSQDAQEAIRTKSVRRASSKSHQARSSPSADPQMSKFTFPHVSAVQDEQTSKTTDIDQSANSKLKRILPGQSGVALAGTAPPLVQPVNAEPVVLFDEASMPSPTSSPARSTDKGTGNSTVLGLGYSLQRELSSDTDIPPTSYQMQARRPSLIREDSISTVLNRLRSGRLSKKFWMRDENATSCFLCDASFNTFRRKHHCRLCGQIFCSNCTTLTSGHRIGHDERFRTCKTCDRILSEYTAMSADQSASELQRLERPQLRLNTSMPKDADVAPALQGPFTMPNDLKPVQTPLMAIPATRTSFDVRDGAKRLEIPNIQLAEVASPARRMTRLDLPQTSVNADLKGREPPPGSAAQWKHGLLGELQNARPFKRRNTFQAASRTPSFERSPIPSRPGSSQDVRSASDDEDYAAESRHPTSRAPRGKLSRHLSLRESPYSVFGHDGSESRKLKRRGLGHSLHTRTKSRSLVRQISVQGQAGPSTPKVGNSSRSRTRSTSSSLPLEMQVSELNLIGRAHIKGLLHQLLRDAHIDDIESWERTLSPILTQVAELVRPKVKEGASAYINNYVKIKRIPGSKMSQTQFISGAVFTNKLAHKRMARHIENPRILLVSFPLEYYRADSQLMSLEPIIAQEKEYLRNLVNRMMGLRPNLVLVDRSVSGLALEYLLENNVAVAYSVKPTIMAIVAELTGADIITSVDRLAFHPRVGKAESFSVKTFINYEPPKPFKKTYMYIQGCPPDLGCTIVLRGATMSTLESIKRIMELMIFVVYNQKLEASLLKDQHAIQRAPESFLALQNAEELNLLDAASNALLKGKPFSKLVELFEHRILSSSPGVQFEPPYLLRKAYDLEKKLERHKLVAEKSESETLAEQEARLLYGGKLDDISDLSPEQQRNVRQIVQSAEESRLQHELEHVKKQWDTLLDQSSELTSPWTRQSISVLYSTVCTETGTPCSLPQTELIEYYKDTYNEYPLGQYVEECVINAMQPCPTVLCQRRQMDHHRSYVHAEARVTVVTEAFPCHLAGMQDTILMWSYCKQCKITSPLVPMSDNSWAFSFGKYLELTFYDKDLCVRFENCPHNLCRDHVRYFGFRDMAVRFDYDPIEIMALSVPQPHIEWKPEGFIRLKNEEFKSLQFKISVFYDSLEFRLYNMNAETLVIEQTEAYKADIALMRQQAKDERVYLIGLLQELFDNSPALDYLCLNRALRATQEKVTRWNVTFEELERLYLPSEKDIRRLTTAHLKKLFLSEEAAARPVPAEEETDGDANRSVSMPVAMPSEKGDAIEKAQPRAKPPVKALSEHALHLTVSMPVIGELDDEPKGFHPRRAYEELIKPKELSPDADEGDGPSHVRTLSEAPAIKSEASSNPRPVTMLRTKSEDAVPLSRQSVSQSSSRNPSIDLRHGMSSIPVPKAPASESLHARKKSTSGALVLSKQIQDLGEAIVGSVEKRWQEQKRFSTLNKDTPQRNKAGETKVSSLAKHFDQLSREFDKERLKARKLLNSRGKPTFAVATFKPKVAVFNNVADVVDESDDEDPNLEPLLDSFADPVQQSNPATLESTPKSTPLMQPQSPHTLSTQSIPEQNLESAHDSKETETNLSDAEDVDSPAAKKTAPKHESELSNALVPAAERSTLLKTLTNFWADRSSSAWTALEYPLPPSEHMFLESDVVIREDEPSSLIAFTLSAEEYIAEIAALREAARRKPAQEDLKAMRSKLKVEDQRIHNTLKNATGTHMRFSWGSAGGKGGIKLASRIFFAEQFDALRRFCGCDDNYVASLSRCVKFDSSGGKSGAAFLKTLDDRLIVKQMTKMETEQFLKFAPFYFEYMAESFFRGLPTCLCKILGFYQITSKNPVTGKFFKMDVMVMENLFYKRKTSRIFDLKGSMRNRKVQQTGKENEVLLDENFVELVSENPLFVREHARRFLKSALHNDTLFLAQNNVMDYSLVVGIDDDKHELVVGIIDFIRTYTWDKKLESWVKERGLVGGGSSKPTVVTPKQYKVRFREAMDRYIYAIK